MASRRVPAGSVLYAAYGSGMTRHLNEEAAARKEKNQLVALPSAIPKGLGGVNSSLAARRVWEHLGRSRRLARRKITEGNRRRSNKRKWLVATSGCLPSCFQGLRFIPFSASFCSSLSFSWLLNGAGLHSTRKLRGVTVSQRLLSAVTPSSTLLSARRKKRPSFSLADYLKKRE